MKNKVCSDCLKTDVCKYTEQVPAYDKDSPLEFNCTSKITFDIAYQMVEDYYNGMAEEYENRDEVMYGDVMPDDLF